ncbi:protein kinase domain-containing protein [Pseudoduganella umbonata]|uniref:Serine/threonine-protein kinase n=1 Tax=Pseudoduganella umbonata TaxID=864828 RepID=A0A4P8HMG2_9BURK|nr:protein kinase [Pseudoduganella umbonata]MBB3219438.1 serine/threonine-protein kinase [Pseudoduganella umbonata]QCP09528.1 serine/threonine protein kinase [Pseudoduganella umbonata]
MPARDTTIALGKGHYRLREQVGASVYGTIWRATALSGMPDVAIKFVNAERMAGAQPGQRERWIASASNEIAFLEALQPWDGRHIVRLVDTGWHDGLPVLALELMSGDLGRHVARRRAQGDPPALPEVLDWIGQLNGALAKVHQHGWRYLDLKPANVLVDATTGTVKLADFGTNRLLEAAQAHSYCGTANWQAPEQFFPAPGGGYATGRHSDYFALGALYFFLVTGAPLRWCAACGDAYREHQSDGARAMLDAGPLPPVLADDEAALFAAAVPDIARVPALRLLSMLLAHAPEDRPRNALHISRMLDAVRAGLGGRAALVRSSAASLESGVSP